MNRWMPFAALLLMAVAVPAEAQYRTLSQRDNDPFVFCTQGMKRPDACWKPIEPFGQANWRFNGFCNQPFEHGRPWTPEEIEALQEFLSVCGIPHSSGEWSGGGSPENSPYSH